VTEFNRTKRDFVLRKLQDYRARTEYVMITAWLRFYDPAKDDYYFYNFVTQKQQ
jgi:hypothetical protein